MRDAKRRLTLLAKIIGLAVVLLIVQAIGATFLPATGGSGDAAQAAETSTAPPGPGFLGLVMSICLLQTLALSLPVVRSRWHGWRLVLAVFVLFFGTVTFLNQLESLVYLSDGMPPGMLGGLFLMGLFNAAVFAPILVVALGGRKQAPAAHEGPESGRSISWKAWSWRLAVGSTVFVTLYYLFGYFVAWKSPEVRAFYGGSDPGSFGAQMAGIVRDTPWMIPFQLFRGGLWVLLALLVVRMMRGRWWEAGLAISLLFTVPAVYLLIPNPLMPEAVRLMHLVETVPYQFAFGWFAAWLFRNDASRDATPVGNPVNSASAAPSPGRLS